MFLGILENDLVSKADLLEAIKNNPEKSAEEIISEMPVINNCAEWIPNPNSGWNCGHCKKYSPTLDKFCSECGFKMTEQVVEKKEIFLYNVIAI